MIRHVCMFSLKEENKEANINEFLTRGEELKKLPMVRAGKLVRCAQGVPNANYDVALIFDFDSVEALNEYQVSPAHVEFGKFIGAIREDRACIDYEL